MPTTPIIHTHTHTLTHGHTTIMSAVWCLIFCQVYIFAWNHHNRLFSASFFSFFLIYSFLSLFFFFLLCIFCWHVTWLQPNCSWWRLRAELVVTAGCSAAWGEPAACSNACTCSSSSRTQRQADHNQGNNRRRGSSSRNSPGTTCSLLSQSEVM